MLFSGLFHRHKCQVCRKRYGDYGKAAPWQTFVFKKRYGPRSLLFYSKYYGICNKCDTKEKGD